MTVERWEQAQTISKDQLILPEIQIPQEVSDILQRAEKIGLTFFEPYHLSDVTLSKDSNVEERYAKLENWYWKQIASDNINKNASSLPDSWVLIDKTQKPNYQEGKQMYEKDPLGILIAMLRKEGKIQKVQEMPDTSRFGILHDELTQAVLPEIAELLELEASAVRLPKAIEFNVIGNFEHRDWGKTDTWEWFGDRFRTVGWLIGGHYHRSHRLTGLSRVSHLQSEGSSWNRWFSSSYSCPIKNSLLRV